MGYFEIPKKDRHTCPRPHITGFESRQGWRCDECGKAYKSIPVTQHGESWYEWMRVPEYDIPPPPEPPSPGRSIRQ